LLALVTYNISFSRPLADISIYLSIFIHPIKDNLNAIGHAVGWDSETKSTEHSPKYKQSTVI